MRAPISGTAALLVLAVAASPLSAQDHSGHAGHEQQVKDEAAKEQLPKPVPLRLPTPQPVILTLPGTEPAPDPHAGHAGMDHGSMDHGAMDHGAMDHSAPVPEAPPPPRALEGPQHAADAFWGAQAMARARKYNHTTHGDMKTGTLMVERLEARIPADGGHDGFLWDVQGWYGGDIDKIAFKTEGEGEFGGLVEDAEFQLLWSRAIGPFFDLQAGARLDVEPETRSHLVLGVQGLAPYMFHVDAAAFLSDRGDLTMRVEAEYDQKITQSLILQPRIELEASVQDIPERETGSGLTKIEPGLRLRYEIVPELAPYIGVEYEARLGETADIARAGGEDPDGVKLLFGIRAWF